MRMSAKGGLTLLVLLIGLAGCSPQPGGEAGLAEAETMAFDDGPVWLRLDAADSRLSVVSIKNNSMAEIHQFPELRGAVGEDGEARLEVALDAVRSGIAIRDQRMREMLFDTARHPLATVALSLDRALLEAMAEGESQRLPVVARLTLRGQSNRLRAELRVSRLTEGRWRVVSEQPVLIDSAHFGLIEGIDALRRVAGLQAIGGSVPVSFSLGFVTP